MTLFISNAAAIAAANAIVDLVDLGSGTSEGRFLVYAGSVPADADASIGAATLLATLLMSNPAFGAASDAAPGAVAVAAAVADDVDADADGTPSFFRIVDRDGTAIMQGSVGATGSGADVEFDPGAFLEDNRIILNSFTFTHPES